jgi:hypothetical protein
MTTFGDQIYHNEASMEDRREALANDTSKGGVSSDTYLSRAQSQVGQELRGRFGRLAEANFSVVGKGPLPYPRPPTGPWAEPDPTGTEPPLGFSVDDVPKVD